MPKKNKEFKFQNLKIKVYPEVYEPSEDTFQLLEAIEIKDEKNLLEIGTGCGIISLFFAKKGIDVISTDINPFALKNTRENLKINKDKIKGTLQVIESDLFDSINENLLFDIVIFNPPYLPTKKEDIFKEDEWLNKAVNGGKDGLKYTEKFILNVDKYLKKNGVAYFVFSSFSNREKLNDIIYKKNFSYEIINSINYDKEKIDIYRLGKK